MARAAISGTIGWAIRIPVAVPMLATNLDDLAGWLWRRRRAEARRPKAGP